jgi:NADH:ubiquinone oxidoreductase subunit 2 (subunit N)
MASETSNSNGLLYFIVGAIVVVLIVFGVMMYNGGMQSPTDRAVENSANAVGDAASEVSNAIPDQPAPQNK